MKSNLRYLSLSKIYFLILFFCSLYSSELKIASYNVENLFDFKKDGTEYKEYIPYKHNWNQKIFKRKLINTAEVICDVNADIIGLQEVENEYVLKLLQKSLRKIGCHYKYLAITHKKYSAIQVALLSKIPIVNAKEIVVNRKLGFRPILETKFIVDKEPFFVYVNHWKSKFSPESYRIRSAKVLRDRLRVLPKGSEYVLLGDFNVDYDEYLHLDRKHNDSRGITGINHILHSIDGLKKMVRVKSLNSNRFLHYNLWLELPNYRRWSHNFYGDKEGLDSILLPYTLFNGKGLEYVSHSFNVLKKSYLFHKKGYIYRWVYRNNRHVGKGYSDHLPIFATFSTKQPYKRVLDKPKEEAPNTLQKRTVHFPLYLTKVKVFSISKNKAIIGKKGSKQRVGIYGTKEMLELGQSYDIMVYGRAFFKGRYEIVDFEIEKRYDTPLKVKD